MAPSHVVLLWVKSITAGSAEIEVDVPRRFHSELYYGRHINAFYGLGNDRALYDAVIVGFADSYREAEAFGDSYVQKYNENQINLFNMVKSIKSQKRQFNKSVKATTRKKNLNVLKESPIFDESEDVNISETPKSSENDLFYDENLSEIEPTSVCIVTNPESPIPSEGLAFTDMETMSTTFHTMSNPTSPPSLALPSTSFFLEANPASAPPPQGVNFIDMNIERQHIECVDALQSFEDVSKVQELENGEFVELKSASLLAKLNKFSEDFNSRYDDLDLREQLNNIIIDVTQQDGVMDLVSLENGHISFNLGMAQVLMKRGGFSKPEPLEVDIDEDVGHQYQMPKIKKWFMSGPKKCELHAGSGVYISQSAYDNITSCGMGQASKLVRYLLKAFYSDDDIAVMSACGTKENSGIPPQIRKAITGFVQKHAVHEKKKVTVASINSLLNKKCCQVRKKLRINDERESGVPTVKRQKTHTTQLKKAHTPFKKVVVNKAAKSNVPPKQVVAEPSSSAVADDSNADCDVHSVSASEQTIVITSPCGLSESAATPQHHLPPHFSNYTYPSYPPSAYYGAMYPPDMSRWSHTYPFISNQQYQRPSELPALVPPMCPPHKMHPMTNK